MLASHTHYAHDADMKQARRNKPSTNLTLSRDCRVKGQKLTKLMNRPSLTNVVEALIVERYQAVFGKPA